MLKYDFGKMEVTRVNSTWVKSNFILKECHKNM